MSSSAQDRFLNAFLIQDYDPHLAGEFPDGDVHDAVEKIVKSYNNMITSCSKYDHTSEVCTQFYAKIRITKEIFEQEQDLYESFGMLQNLLFFDPSYKRSYQMQKNGFNALLFVPPADKLAPYHTDILKKVTLNLQTMLIHDKLEFTKLPTPERNHLYSEARRNVMSQDKICYMYRHDVSTLLYMIYLRALLCSTYANNLGMSNWVFNVQFKPIAKLVVLFPTNSPILSYNDAMLVKTVENLKLFWDSIPFCPMLVDLLDVLEVSVARLVTRVCSSSELTVACYRNPLQQVITTQDNYAHSDVFVVSLQTSLVSLRKTLFVIRNAHQKIIPEYQSSAIRINHSLLGSNMSIIKYIYPTKTQSKIFYSWIYEFARNQSLITGIGKDIYELGMTHSLPPGVIEWCGKLVQCSKYSNENFLEKIYSAGFTSNTKEFNQLPMIEYLSSGSSLAVTVCCIALLKHTWKSVFDTIPLAAFLFQDPRSTFERYQSLNTSPDPKIVCTSGEVGVYYGRQFYICPDAVHALIFWTNLIVFIQNSSLSNGVNITKLLYEIYGKKISEKLFTQPVKPFYDFEQMLVEYQLQRNQTFAANSTHGELSVIEL